MNVCLEAVLLPALKHVSVSDGGASRFGNNDKGRRLQANCERTAYRILRTTGERTDTGLFVDDKSAIAYALARGWYLQ